LVHNFDRVTDLTHQLKGIAGCYGLTTICAAANALHDAAGHPERRETIQKCFQTLTEEAAPHALAKAA
jgi:HPt (histidine-containing phosphotransfer) domain-containing protein